MSLQSEIEARSREIVTDGYPMSIGEIMNLYRDGELDIHPEFQRFLRWSQVQKTRLIESLLLGIPLPSIFVSQRKDGVWDVIDGLQRLGTIFQFSGILKDEEGKPIAPLQLLGTKYLPSLAGKYWECDDSDKSLTNAQRLIIKRTKLDIKIIKSDSSETSKYELFHRLNTYGTQLSDQEVRNCMLIMTNRTLFTAFKKLADLQDFKECIPLTGRQVAEQYDLELVLRFLLLKNVDLESLNFNDLGEYLTDKMLELAQDPNYSIDVDAEVFAKTFALLRGVGLDADSFRRFDSVKNKFTGSFMTLAFEVIALGIGHRLSQDIAWQPNDLLERIRNLWTQPGLEAGAFSGLPAYIRIPKTLALGRNIFGQ